MDLSERLAGHLHAGEVVQDAIPGWAGVYPALFYIPFIWWIVGWNRSRLVVFTDRRILVFATGLVRRRTPRALLASVHRDVSVRKGRWDWVKVSLGDERVWIPHKSFERLERAAHRTRA